MQADASADDLSRLIGKPDAAAAPVAAATEKEDAALRLTPNKNKIIRLDQDAASVVVNNPKHASVMLDSPRLIIIMPRLPGTTSFTVLNSAGETILQKDVIVTNVQPQYVRVRRVCASGDTSCTPAAYYYCPDGCYEVTPVAPGAAGSEGNIPPPPVAATTAAAAATDSPAPAPPQENEGN
ncbi:MAG: pilus assembly protein N-terminal domain-containing protein [Alphaproteobacteria bacterium]|nr:pilus assembly protein N-terminal domain-containing protein [Alphaproteobacteria bacterium]